MAGIIPALRAVTGAPRYRHNTETMIPFITALSRRHGCSRVNQARKTAGNDLARPREALKAAFPES